MEDEMGYVYEKAAILAHINNFVPRYRGQQVPCPVAGKCAGLHASEYIHHIIKKCAGDLACTGTPLGRRLIVSGYSGTADMCDLWHRPPMQQPV